MSDTALAILIVPFLITLTAALECGRIGCTKLARHLRETRLRRVRTEVARAARADMW